MNRQEEEIRQRVRSSSRDATSPPAHLRQKGPMLSEDEMLELQRQEDLRRQIQIKERELEEMSKINRERINRHSFGGSDSQNNLANSAYLHQTKSNLRSGSNSGAQPSPRGYQRTGNSPLRGNREDSRDGGRVTGFMSNYARSLLASQNQNRDQVEDTAKVTITSGGFSVGKASNFSRPPIPQPEIHPRQPSPNSPALRKKSYGASRSPTRDIDMRDASQGLLTGARPKEVVSPVRAASTEYITQLQADNTSLEKRLNLVLSELERITRDRNIFMQKVSVIEQEVQSMQAALDGRDGADRLNNDLKVKLGGDRDSNLQLKAQITDTDSSRKDAIAKLRSLQAERDRLSHICSELKDDYQKKSQLSKQLENEQYKAHERLHQLEMELGQGNRKKASEDGQIDDVRHVADKIGVERDDLHDKLQNLSRSYENCVSEIQREHDQMKGHNTHHNKLIVGKVIFGTLEKMFKRRKQDAVNEFFQYCKFDTKCHSILKQFVENVERLGKFRKQIAIKQWHQRCFKPIEAKIQEEELCMDFRRKKLLSKMFNMWRFRQQNIGDVYEKKNKALVQMWNAKIYDCNKDMLRAFSIWRDKMNYQKFRNLRCKKLIWKTYSNKLAKAWQNWNNFSESISRQTRLHVLAREFSQNQYKRIIFAEMRFVLFDMRRKRLNRLRIYVKAWKESNQYRKFIIAANMHVLGFKKQCNRSTLKMCFDALRVSKEHVKLEMMTEAYETDFTPAIDNLQKEVQRKEQQVDRSCRNRGVNAIKAKFYRNLAQYFNKWKESLKRQNVVVDQNLRGMLIRRWRSLESDAFALWKNGKAHKDITMQQMEMTELQEEGSSLAGAVENLEKEIKIEKAKVDRCARQSLTRGTRIMKNRYLKQCMDKWSEVNRQFKTQQGGSDVVLQKVKKYLYRQAFDLFVAGCARKKLAERSEDSAVHLKQTLNSRKLRKCFNAMKDYNSQNNKAKTYSSILLNKMDHWMKKRAFAKWQQGGNIMKVETLLEKQNTLTEEMLVKNKELGNKTKRLADKSAKNQKLQRQLTRTSSFIISNSFSRGYFKRAAQAFKIWKTFAEQDNHKTRIIKRTINHMRKWNSKYLLKILLDWRAKANINAASKKILDLEYEMHDANLGQIGDSASFEKQKAAITARTREVNAQIEVAQARHIKVMALMTDKNQNNHFQGRLRYIYLQWAAHTKRQRHFASCIQNVILKSIWQRGFQNIREFSRDKQMTRNQNKSLAKFRRLFWAKTCGGALNKWRQTEQEITYEMIEETQIYTQQQNNEHLDRKNTIRDWNIDRSLNMLNRRSMADTFKKLRNVTRLMRNTRVAAKNLQEQTGCYKIKRLINKWRLRTELTIEVRSAYLKFQQKRDHIYKWSCFRELMLKRHRDKTLSNRLGNMTHFFNNKNLQSAFQMIKNFSITKKNVYGCKKGLSSQILSDCLNKIYLRKMLSHYTELRKQVLASRIENSRLKMFFSHFISASTRDAFNRWKKKAQCAQTVIEVNEGGPVVEDVLDSQMDIMNLRSLMTEEGFPDYKVEEITHEGEKRGNALLARSIGRWKHWNGTDDYLKPKMFDRWRNFVKMRKVVKHWLSFLDNRQDCKKADLSHSFLKWKHFFADKQNNLKRHVLKDLKTRAVLAAKRLEVLADATQEDEDLVEHISEQNAELSDNYNKSKRLACALGRDNLRNSMMKSYSTMIQRAFDDRHRQLEDVLQKNIDTIGALKDKIKELENGNDTVADENEELRKFSLDGYQLGRNVQTLTNERELLSVDLSDKADMIKRLLDENENLNVRLRQAQESASQLSKLSQARQAV